MDVRCGNPLPPLWDLATSSEVVVVEVVEEQRVVGWRISRCQHQHQGIKNDLLAMEKLQSVSSCLTDKELKENALKRKGAEQSWLLTPWTNLLVVGGLTESFNV